MTLQSTQRIIGYILLAAVFGFAVYSNVRLAVRNYDLRQAVQASKDEVESLKRRNEKLRLLLGFYETEEYQEVEAKRRLGLKRKDETAVLVSGLPANSLADTLEDFVYREPESQAAPQDTNLQKWWKYIRGDYSKK
jgi:cell division protein FtsB